MNRPAHDQSLSPLCCPQCGAAPARPTRIESSDHERLVLLVRCHSCAGEWRVTIDDPPVSLAPKRDRRAVPRHEREI